jgi:putative heme-binding domain-containing protein
MGSARNTAYDLGRRAKCDKIGFLPPRWLASARLLSDTFQERSTNPMRGNSCGPLGAVVFMGVIVAGCCTMARTARADAIGEIKLPEGFRAELVYSVPLEEQGSWVCLALDGRGRLIASDQNGGLYRVEPSPVGGKASATKVASIPVTIGRAQGLLVVGDALYVVMNGRVGAFGSGLYRLTDSNADDQYDHVEQLRVFQGDGEHGPHAVVLGPDGKSLYLVCGNMTALPMLTRSRVPQHWGEDQLLPRIYDPGGHANTVYAPGGWVARTDLDGKDLELFSAGYRNAYDIAFDADGELFTFDSDMEWDIGTPWYRPTRICHVVSGSDFGWRSGNGPWPQYFIDTLPTVADVGPGSPTGVAFGAGTKFPGRYQRAMFAGDWSYGNIYAIHLSPHGASYRGEVERFASAMPLGVTDIVVRPQDGALYFTVGGRQSESALYRIVAVEGAAAAETGASNTDTAPTAPARSPEKDRELRRWLENLHVGPREGVADAAWPFLGHEDRSIRYAARVAIEHQPSAEWRQRALAEPAPLARLQALAALARTGTRDDQAAWSEALVQLKFADLGRDERLDFLRSAALGVIRFYPVDEEVKTRLIGAVDPSFPAGDHLVDREAAALLIRLRADRMVERLLAIQAAAATQEEAIDAAVALSAIPSPWTTDQRKQLLDWFDHAASLRGGQSSFGYIVAARERFINTFTGPQRTAFAERISKPLVESTAPVETTSRTFVHEWTLDELVAAVEKDAGTRDLANGRRMFSAATCYNCHRVSGEGSSVGPDLTGVGGRFGVRDILRAIVEPNHEISDQYRQTVFETNGRVITGRVTNLYADTVMVSTNMLDPKSELSIRRDAIDEQYPSETSVMPGGLLNTLSESEVLDLLAFLRDAGTNGGGASLAAPPPSPALPAEARESKE